MRFSENWLRTLVNPPYSSNELAQVLTMAGLEVESMEAVAPPFDNVVVAEVVSIQKHLYQIQQDLPALFYPARYQPFLYHS